MSVKISELAKKLGMDTKVLRTKIQGLYLGVSPKANVFNDELAVEIERRIKPADDEIENKTTSEKIEGLSKNEKLKIEKTEKISEDHHKFDNKIGQEVKEQVTDIAEETGLVDASQSQLSKIFISSSVSVGELAQKMQLPVADIIKELMKNGVLANINERIDFETAAIIGEDLGFEVELEKEKEDDLEIKLRSLEKYADDTFRSRPPIVTVMGHVDHGKTSILDQIRHAQVVASESGGITQHMGAYQVVKNGKKITFLDTPGHKAFSAMRAHGAKLTDVAVLVVAADDGVKPQTVEAINHARAAGVPIVIAINKIDKPGANVDRVKRELSDYNLISEEWGGKTIMVQTSAKTGEGIDNLLEMILLVAEMEDLKAYYDGPAQAVVIEAHLSKRVGPVATVMVTQGSLSVRDAVVAGMTDGVVRAMVDYKGDRITKAFPSDPVRIAGLTDVPEFGDTMYGVEGVKVAKMIVDQRKRNMLSKGIRTKSVGMAELSQAVREGRINELPIVLKVDVQGSLEAIKSSLDNLRTNEVKVTILHEAVGQVNESDVMMAASSNALILSFRSKVEPNALKIAKKMGVKISDYDVIYRLIDDVTAALEGLLAPEEVKTKVGKGKVLKVFTHGKKFRILGVNITKGRVEKSLEVIVFRGGEKIGEAKVENLQKGTDAVDHVNEHNDCGIGLAGNIEVEEGDTMEFWKTEVKMRRL
ncbi:MAG TPA: translation initiation factor IF-2 [bacterium]|nr:translation initiation factor IF-2 [bacterium]